MLIFDGGEDDKEKLQDRHHEHFREVCLLLKDADIGVQYGRCVFDAGSALAAGFQLDKLGTGDVSEYCLFFLSLFCLIVWMQESFKF